MSELIPAEKPVVDKKVLFDLLQVQMGTLPIDKYPVVLVGLRGYLAHTRGQGVNERGIYDDAIGIIERGTIDGAYLFCNGNTDPSATYSKGVACLKAGIWFYKRGKHGVSRGAGYDAFVQARAVTVTRDGIGDDTGMFYINIHRGGVNTTSSLGCQTVPPAQWPAFQALGYMLTKKYSQDLIPYILVQQ